MGWPNFPEQIGMRKGGMGRESLDFVVYHEVEAQPARIPPSPITMRLKNSVAPTGPWKGWWEGDVSCEPLIWMLSPQDHRCSSPHHQCSHLRERAPSPRTLGSGGTGLRAGGNWEGPRVCLTTEEVVHTSPQTHMPYFRPGV